MLITFEGIDGSGKTTQIKLLADYLKKSHEVVITEEPTNNVIGKALKKRINHNWVEAIMFAADRALHSEEVIIPNNDKIIICDRYIHSSLAYQPAMGLSQKWIKCLNMNAVKPDLTIYLDLKPETALSRVKKRSKRIMKYEELNVLKKVRKNYLRMRSKSFKVVNAEKSIKEVQEEIRRIINDFMRQGH